MIKKTILSGMRPTGKLHFGHLHGALLNWKRLQDDYSCYYFIADWHALTSEYSSPGVIKESTPNIIKDWLMVGLDPKVCTFFVQSAIPEHAELFLILSMITPLPWLERNPTYKDQMQELTHRDIYTYGFLGYPVLQASDILMYKASGVPVGIDQAPHVEMTREIARRFNFIYETQLFPEPETLLTPTSRILGIDRRKMSKSYGNAIYLTDSDIDIDTKTSQMITDPQRAKKTDPGRPDVCNVFTFHEIYSCPDTVKTIDSECKNAAIGCVECKRIMANSLKTYLIPFREKRSELTDDLVNDVINDGNGRARKRAKETISQVREVMGI